MEITITCPGETEAEDIRSLRAWLPKANPALEDVLRDGEPAPDRLGGGDMLMAVLAVISAGNDLRELVKAVAGWVHNRHGQQVDTEPRVTNSAPAPDGRHTVTTITVGTAVMTVNTPAGEPLPEILVDRRAVGGDER